MVRIPLCKTAILRFLISKDTVPKIWNMSSNTRKRMQMVMEEMEIRLKEYSEKILKIKDWVSLGRDAKYINQVANIKKGVYNYRLETQEQADKVVSLNQKLRCFKICFEPEAPLEVDSIGYLNINLTNFDFFSKCTFRKVSSLDLRGLTDTQIKEILSKFKKIKKIIIKDASISNLDLISVKVSTVLFENTIFTEKVKLPSSLEKIGVYNCKNLHLLICKKVTALSLNGNKREDSIDLVSRLREVREVNIFAPLSKYINFLPNSVRILGFGFNIGSDKIDLSAIDSKFSYFTRIYSEVPVELGQALNLRSIYPTMSVTEEKFTYRPKEIKIDRDNVEQLNKHPELFEKVEGVVIDANSFDYDYLPNGIKKIQFYNAYLTGGKTFNNLESNNWKFENALIDTRMLSQSDARKVLSCLQKARKISINYSEELIEEYSHLKSAFIY